jgi:hypothetical protein
MIAKRIIVKTIAVAATLIQKPGVLFVPIALLTNAKMIPIARRIQPHDAEYSCSPLECIRLIASILKTKANIAMRKHAIVIPVVGMQRIRLDFIAISPPTGLPAHFYYL